ncbi:MAG: PP2C family protein-serine/threonine phosphatase [Candidatus Rifleibacteriota bacterium]
MPNKVQNFSSKFYEKLILTFMLLAISISIFIGMENWFKEKIESVNNKTTAQRKKILQDIVRLTEPEAFYNKKLLPLLRLITEKNKDIDTIHSFYRQKYGIELNIYQFSDKNKLSAIAPSNAPNKWLIKKLYPALREKSAKELSDYAKQLDKKIEFAYGYGKDLVSIKESPERLIETTFDNKNGFLAWTSRKNGGVILYCQQLPDRNEIFQQQIKNFKAQIGLEKTGLFALNSEQDSYKLVKSAHNHLVELSTDSGIYAGKFWIFLKSISGKIYFARFSTIKNFWRSILFKFRLILAIVIFVFIAFIVLSNSALNLKVLLTCMFMAASLIPLGSIALTAYENLEIYQEIETNKIKAGQEEVLGNISHNFSAYLASCSTTLYRLTSDPGESAESSKTAAMKKNILAIFPEAKITVRNSGGEILFYHGPIVSDGRETVFKSLSRKLIERYAPKRLDEHEYQGNQFVDSIVSKDDMGFGTLLNFPDKLQLIETGNSQLLLFFRLLRPEKGDCAIVLVELSPYETIKKYLRSLSLQRFTIDNRKINIAAFFPAGYRWSLPPSYKLRKPALDLAERAWVTGRSQSRHIKNGASGFMHAGNAESLLGNYLVAFCSDDHITRTLDEMRFNIIWGAVAIVALLSLIVFWLYRQLISPLAGLSNGVKALARRNFAYRLPELPGKDEIANLFSAYNEMMAESYDMQIAKNVQEGLVPQKFPDVPGFSVHGMLKEASDLGGDCLDCFMVNEEKLLFLIGDITGHGVGSALMMAFSKAVTFHWSQEESDPTPATLADQIDKMLRKNKTSKMFMGVICGILDIKTGTIELVVKGHIYPLLIKADKKTEWIGLPAYPLGIAKFKNARSISFKLETGDKLLCITDGILESRKNNCPVGFEGIESWAIETCNDNAETWINALEDRYNKHADNDQKDDISIFAICNNRKEPVNEK